MRAIAMGLLFTIATASPGAAQGGTDLVQLATGLIWCYQNPNHQVEPYVDGWTTWIKNSDGQTWVEVSPDVRVSRSRDEYVRDIRIAAVRGDAQMVKDIYFMCQRHSARPLEYGREATTLQFLSAARHTVGCYDPGAGTNSARWPDGHVEQTEYGSFTCKPLGSE